MPELVVITGMSGAGRSTASNALEDLGFFVIDNLPARLILDVVAWEDRRDRLAVVVDTRGGLNFEVLEQALDELAAREEPAKILFLDAGDEVLLARFQESRRPHPVPMPTLQESIAAERAALGGILERADVVLDTGGRSVHDLRASVQEEFADARSRPPLRVTITSFGFKHGLPQGADTVVDVRFLPNPHWIAALRDLTGLDRPVREYVMEQEDAATFLERLEDLMLFLLPRYEAEGKAYFTLAIGCTGGHHRSVVVAEHLAARLREEDVPVNVTHRDIER